MIQLPDAIVIYPHKKSDPSYLLCWVPAKAYPAVVISAEKRAELEQLYPDGIEVELSNDGLQEAGIALETTPERLKRAYAELLERGLLPASGMVELAALVDYLAAGRPQGPEEFSFDTAGGDEAATALADDELRRRLAGGPPMTAGRDPKDVYRRLDVRRGRPSRGSGG